MALPQQKFREIVFQFLFCYDFTNADPKELIQLFMKELSVSKSSVVRAEKKASDVLKFKDKIDHLILSSSSSYAFDRIQKVEVNILRLGVYELLFDDEIPPKVAISEAIRLTKKFSTSQAAKFVNAVLDKIYQQEMGNSALTDDEQVKESIDALIESEEVANQATLEDRGELENDRAGDSA